MAAAFSAQVTRHQLAQLQVSHAPLALSQSHIFSSFSLMVVFETHDQRCTKVQALVNINIMMNIQHKSARLSEYASSYTSRKHGHTPSPTLERDANARDYR